MPNTSPTTSSSPRPSIVVRISRMIVFAVVVVAGSFATASQGSASPWDEDTYGPKWLADTTRFEPVAPCRLVDTRSGPPLAPGTDVVFEVAGQCDVSADATAVAITVTGTGAARSGYFTLWPADRSRPDVSTLNLSASETRANSAIVRLGRGGALSVHADAGGHLLIDVTGSFVPVVVAKAGRFEAVPPQRVIDTRSGDRPEAGSTITAPLPAGVPADATALAVNLTTTDSAGVGYFTAFASGSPIPEASVLNTDGPGQTRAASAIVPVSPQGLEILTSGGDHVILDVTGYFTGPSAQLNSTGLFIPLDPVRLLETRTANELAPSGHRLFRFPDPFTIGQVAGTVTMIVEPGAGGFATLCAPNQTLDCGEEVSNVNADSGPVANGFVGLTLDRMGLGWVRSSSSAHILIDVSGGFLGEAAEHRLERVPNGSHLIEPAGPGPGGVSLASSDLWARQYAVVCMSAATLDRLDGSLTRWFAREGGAAIAAAWRSAAGIITWIELGTSIPFDALCDRAIPHEAMHVFDYVSGDPSAHLARFLGPLTELQSRECLAQVAEVMSLGRQDQWLSYDDDPVIASCTRSEYAADLGRVLWDRVDGTWFRWDGDAVVPR